MNTISTNESEKTLENDKIINPEPKSSAEAGTILPSLSTDFREAK
jgi:hypothetical protein